MSRRPILSTFFALALIVQVTCNWCILANCADAAVQPQAEVSSCHHADSVPTPEKPVQDCGHRQVLADGALLQARTALTAVGHAAVLPEIFELTMPPEPLGLAVPDRIDLLNTSRPSPLNLRI